MSNESRFFGWEIMVLGRLESEKNSFGGTLRSTTTITIDSQLIHRDFFDYSPEMGQSSWGLNGNV